MSRIPESIEDIGYVNVSEYALYEVVFLKSLLIIHFKNKAEIKSGFIIKMEGIAAFNDWTQDKTISMLRVDSSGSSFGLDVSLRLKNDEYADYKLMYLFEDIDHTSIVFKGLTKSIEIVNYEGETPSLFEASPPRTLL